MNRSKLQAFIGCEDRRLFSSPSGLQYSEWHSKYAEKPSPILSLLWWTGLLEDSNKTSRIVSRIISLFFILLSVDIFAGAVLQPYASFFLVLIYDSNYFMSLIIWFLIRRRRKQLTGFLRLLHEIQPQTMARKLNIILYGIFISNLAIAALNVNTRFRAQLATHMTFGYKVDNFWAQVLVIFTKSVLYGTLYPTCPTVVAFLLCLFCQRMCHQVHHLTLMIEKCSPEQFTILFQSNILSRKSRLDDALILIQGVFYLPSFFICAISFCSCCTLVAWILQGFDHSLESSMMLTFFIYFFMCSVSLLACMWTAGGLPVELEAFNEEFHKKALLRLLKGGCGDDLDLQKHLSDRPVFVLTGCDVIHFKRSSILTLAGAVLTYTLLILKM